MTTNNRLKQSMDMKCRILLQKFKLLLIAIQNGEQSFKFTNADLKEIIGNKSINVNSKIDSTYLEEPESGFGITKWDSSKTSKILENVMRNLYSCFLNTSEEHEIMYKDAEHRPVWNFAFEDCFAIDEYQLMHIVLNRKPHPSFCFIHEEHTWHMSSKPSYSIVTNARGIYLIVVIVIVSLDSQRVKKRQQGLMEARQFKEQFRIANKNDEKVVCVLGAIIMNETKMDKSTIIFVDEKDEAIARAADENYLVNKKMIDEIYLEVARPVMEHQDELRKQDLKEMSCHDNCDLYDDYEFLNIEDLSEEEIPKHDWPLHQQPMSISSSILIVLVIMLIFSTFIW